MKARRTLAALAAIGLGLTFAPALAHADEDLVKPNALSPDGQYDFRGETCAEPLPFSVEAGSTVPMSLCENVDGEWTAVPGEPISVYATDDNDVNNVTQGEIINTLTTNDEGQFGLDLSSAQTDYIGVTPEGEEAPAVIWGADPTQGTPDPTPSDTPEPTPSDTPEPTPTDTPEPTPSDTPEPTADPTETVDPNVVVSFGDESCDDVGTTYTPGETYTFTACNALGEPIVGAEVQVYETADGNIDNLQNGTLVETLTTNEQGQFELTIPAEGYIGVISGDARFIIGQDPHGGDEDGDGNRDDDDDDNNDGRLPSTGV